MLKLFHFFLIMKYYTNNEIKLIIYTNTSALAMATQTFIHIRRLTANLDGFANLICNLT